VFPENQHVWVLSKGGDQSLGLACTENGLFLGRTPLVERLGGVYALRPHGDLERLLARAYRVDISVNRLAPGLATVASALARNNLCLAQIAALHLRLPDLPDMITRAGLEAEDLVIKGERGDGQLARAGRDEAEHPRAGTPPNPGRFAPKDGSGDGLPPMQSAQRGRGGREPEEILDPAAPVRQAIWNARIALLRRIDPNNPHLTYLANPNSPPRQEALDRLDAAIEAASIRRVTDKVMPNGRPIGRPGNSPKVRELPGGVEAAREMFDFLGVGGTVHRSDPDMEIVRLPGEAGFLTLRQQSRSGDVAIDVKVPGVPFRKIHFH
jgi:hypothetical protein